MLFGRFIAAQRYKLILYFPLLREFHIFFLLMVDFWFDLCYNSK